MSTSNAASIPDPLSDRFAIGDLPRYAPWVAERIEAVGLDKMRTLLGQLGHDPDEPQLMTTWFSALTRSEGHLWTEQGYWDAA
jgi:hypothetical protein